MNPPVELSDSSTIIHSSTYENREHTNTDFLNRVYTIDNFVWNRSANRGDILRTYRFPDVLLSQPALYAKLRNFFGLRAGVQLIVLINRQPFQAGNLLISYLPAARYNTAKAAMAAISLPTLTGMTRVNLDLMSASVAELSVPYVSPHVYYNLLTGEGTIGDFYITCYSPLTDVADTGEVKIEVQARFLDPHLEFPTGTSPITNNLFSPLTSLIDNLNIRPSLSNLKSLKKTINQLLEKSKNGEIQLQMNDKINTINITPKALPNMSVTNSNNSHIMSLSSSNVLPSMELGGNRNEMDILSVVQVPCFHDSFTITNQEARTNVWVKQVHPLVPASTNSDSSLNVDYVYFHALPFSKWSSSFIYTFKVVKTRFHSLRLRVWFSPASDDESAVDRNATISKIVDLKEQNEFQFSVPYVWPHPKLNVHSLPQSLGIIGVDIVNPMVYPSTVDPSIDVIVERAAGPDFKVHLVTPLQAFPMIPSPAKLKKKVEEKIKDETFAYDPIVDPLVNIIPYSDEDPYKVLTKNIIQSGNFNDVGKAINYVNSLSKDHANVLNWYNSLSPITASSLILPIGVILQKLKEGKMHILSKRSEDDFVPDLTTEGIESNPGPTETLANFVSDTTTSRTLTSTLTGPMTIQIQTIQYLDTSDIIFISFSGDYTSQSFPVGKSFSYTKFDYPGDTPSITFTQVDPFQGGFAWVVITFSNDSNSLSIDGTVDTNITNTPLPVTINSTTDSIVTKTSIDLQMNTTNEQDNERVINNNFVRPQQSNMADNYCLGSRITSVKDMVCRSGAVYNNSTLPAANLLNVYPHMFGLVQGSFTDSNALDILSYYASSYSFARGGINLRFLSAPDFSFLFTLSGDNFYSTSADGSGIVHQNGGATTQAYRRSLGGALQQVIKPDLEGYGEISIPFYSDSYMYYISPSVSMDTTAAMTELRLPYTTCLLELLGDLTNLVIYRAASSDFEMSFLNGPPVLLSNN